MDTYSLLCCTEEAKSQSLLMGMSSIQLDINSATKIAGLKGRHTVGELGVDGLMFQQHVGDP